MSTKALATVQATKDLVISQRSEFAKILTRHIDPERFERMAVNCVVRQPKLLQCEKTSFLNALMFSATLDLEPDTPLQHCHLIPYGSRVQWIPGYRGLLELARRSGEISELWAECVFEMDKFEVHKGLHKDIIHVPELKLENNSVVAAYAICKFKDGGTQFEVMSRGQIDKVRDASKAGRSGPWVDHYPEMAKKTVLRRLSKYLPLCSEFRRAEEIDNEDFEKGTTRDVREVKEIKSMASFLDSPSPTEEEVDAAFAKDAPIREPGEEG